MAEIMRNYKRDLKYNREKIQLHKGEAMIRESLERVAKAREEKARKERMRKENHDFAKGEQQRLADVEVERAKQVDAWVQERIRKKNHSKIQKTEREAKLTKDAHATISKSVEYHTRDASKWKKIGLRTTGALLFLLSAACFVAGWHFPLQFEQEWKELVTEEMVLRSKADNVPLGHYDSWLHRFEDSSSGPSTTVSFFVYNITNAHRAENYRETIQCSELGPYAPLLLHTRHYSRPSRISQVLPTFLFRLLSPGTSSTNITKNTMSFSVRFQKAKVGKRDPTMCLIA